MLEEFLKELKSLCDKYNASITGCGCCGSPSVYLDSENEKKWSTSHDDLRIESNNPIVKCDGKEYRF